MGLVISAKTAAALVAVVSSSRVRESYGLVSELQSDALDRDIPVSDLLRKALVVSKKLGVKHIEKWLNYELSGYDNNKEIPPYREIHGQIKVQNPYHGWQPVIFENSSEEAYLTRRKIGQPVGELDSLNTGESHDLQIKLPPLTVNRLMAGMDVQLPPALIASSTEIIGILDAVRNNVLRFSLQLEQEGIHGEGMSFSKEEKQTAAQITYRLANNIGSMQDSQIQQHSAGNQTLNLNADLRAVAEFVSRLRTSADKLGLEEDTRKELLAEIATAHSQADSPRPKRAVIVESMKTIRNILEGAAGSLLAAGFLAEMAKLF